MGNVERYREKHVIVPTGDEGSERCAHDGFRVRRIKNGWRHDVGEIERAPRSFAWPVQKASSLA